MFNSHEEALKFVADQDIELIDIRFCDLIGTSQHFTIPADQFADALENGLMFDGSSIRGFTSIDKSDMKLIADVSDAYVDPCRACPTLVVNCSIVDPFTDAPFPRDPRQVASKAEAYLRSTGIADTCVIGA